MSFFTTASPSINSTYALQTNPDTNTIMAELDSTMLGTNFRGGNFLVNWIIGASTGVRMVLEQVLSTGLDFSTAGRDRTYVFASSGMSAQFQTKQTLEKNDRLRVRMDAAITAVAAAKIVAERLD